MAPRIGADNCCSDASYTTTAVALLKYDPLGRLWLVQDSATGNVTQFMYDGDAMVAEYNGSGTLQHRYIHGPAAGVDDSLIWYPGTSISNGNARYLLRDPRGSIILIQRSNGNHIALNAYDEYGIPSNGNSGRFQYTGQSWLEEIGLYYYKARMYSPTLGRFLQTDPIGYEDNVNLYAYVANDPINPIDPTGKSRLRRILAKLIELAVDVIVSNTSPLGPIEIEEINIPEIEVPANPNPIIPLTHVRKKGDAAWSLRPFS